MTNPDADYADPHGNPYYNPSAPNPRPFYYQGKRSTFDGGEPAPAVPRQPTGRAEFEHTARQWTAGELRAALDGVPDNTPVEVAVPDAPDGDAEDTYVVTGLGYGQVDWADGRGLLEDRRSIEIAADWPSGVYYRNGGAQ